MGVDRLFFLNRAGVLAFVEEPGDQAGGGEPRSAEVPDDKGVDPKSSDEQLGEGGLKALQAERKAAKDAVKRAEAAEARLKEIADAEKTEGERALERIAELEAENAKYKSEKARTEIRSRVLSEKNVPSEWADFVSGDSEDEIAKSADRILANLSKADLGPKLQGTSGSTGGSVEAGREAAKNYRP